MAVQTVENVLRLQRLLSVFTAAGAPLLQSDDLSMEEDGTILSASEMCHKDEFLVLM